MSDENTIAQLTKDLQGFTDSVRAEYGATKDKIEEYKKQTSADIGEMRDRLSQAADQLAKMDEVTQIVLDLQKAQEEFKRNVRVVPEFDQPFLRELIHPPFRVVYRRDSRHVRIVRVWRSERELHLPTSDHERPSNA